MKGQYGHSLICDSADQITITKCLHKVPLNTRRHYYSTSVLAKVIYTLLKLAEASAGVLIMAEASAGVLVKLFTPS